VGERMGLGARRVLISEDVRRRDGLRCWRDARIWGDRGVHDGGRSGKKLTHGDHLGFERGEALLVPWTEVCAEARGYRNGARRARLAAVVAVGRSSMYNE
jgi:hypothetical protein